MTRLIVFNKSLCPMINETAEEDYCIHCDFCTQSKIEPDKIQCKFPKPDIKEITGRLKTDEIMVFTLKKC